MGPQAASKYQAVDVYPEIKTLVSNLIRIIKRIDRRTVYESGGCLKVRYDSPKDRIRCGAAFHLLECVRRQDIKAAAAVIVEALDDEVFDDEDDLLSYIDDEAREIIRLEISSNDP